MKITIHRGAEEVGGNTIELQSGKSRILLDYGAPRYNAQGEQQQTTLNIPGLYDDKASDPILAILVSHTHADHYGALLARPVYPRIKVFMSEIMEDVIRITAKMPSEPQKLTADIHYFRKGHKFIVGGFVITPFLMDHTAAESFAFLIEAGRKRVIYTGDYREHGIKAAAFKQLLAAKPGPIDALITEGTQAGIEKGPTEPEIMAHIEANLKGRDGPLYVMCAGQDIGLLTSLAQLAKNTRRFLVVDGYVALLLERLKHLAEKQGVELKAPSLETEFLRIVRNKATQRIFQLSEYMETFRRMRPRMYGWDWINDNLDRLIIPVRANAQHWVGEEIKDFSKATLIYSDWETYGEEEGMQETLEWFRGRCMAGVPTPSSHHAYFSTIRKLVENKKPRYIIPINTEHQDKFTQTFGKRAKILNNGEEFTLD